MGLMLPGRTKLRTIGIIIGEVTYRKKAVKKKMLKERPYFNFVHKTHQHLHIDKGENIFSKRHNYCNSLANVF